jgi:hypothetical protein
MFLGCNDAADMGCDVCFGAWIIFMSQPEKGTIAPPAVSVFCKNYGISAGAKSYSPICSYETYAISSWSLRLMLRPSQNVQYSKSSIDSL